MQRLDATRIAVELAGESPIIGGVGNSTFDLVPFDRPRNFYMWNSMGMASSRLFRTSGERSPSCSRSAASVAANYAALTIRRRSRAVDARP